MMKRNFLLTGAVAAVMSLTVGCEWTGTSSEESWNDAYSWANFSGTYHLYNTVDPTEESTESEVLVSSEGVGSTSDTDSYGGTLGRRPVVAGSLVIQISGTTFTDQGDGTLAGGQSGTINYATGAWSARTLGTPPVEGQPIIASYRYLLAGTVTSPGSALTTLTVNQKGNLLTFTDNNGMVYSGRVTGANVPSDSRVSANVRINFEVASSSARIIGTLSGDWSGGTTGTLSNRSMLGTYSAQGGIDVDIEAASGSIAITPQPITTN